MCQAVSQTRDFRTLGPSLSCLRVLQVVVNGQCHPAQPSSSSSIYGLKYLKVAQDNALRGLLLTFRWYPHVPGVPISCYIQLSRFVIGTMWKVRQGLIT